MRVGLAAVLLAVLALAACGGSDEAAAPLTLEQRLVEAGDVPAGFAPDGTPASTTDVDQFISGVSDTFVQATPEQVHNVLTDAGFVAATNGGFAKSENANIGSAAVQFASEDGANAALDFAYNDTLLPCLERCDIAISEFDVPDIPDAKGVQRSRTEQSAAGTGDAEPGPLFDSYEVSFVNGPFLYVVRGFGNPPGSVTEDQVIAAAQALYERVDGAPLPEG